MLFSEPKIPQKCLEKSRLSITDRFSALQRAENSSNALCAPHPRAVGVFQCSSASRKFLKRTRTSRTPRPSPFQCSSASRKFLKSRRQPQTAHRGLRFSALQRAENSSNSGRTGRSAYRPSFSALQRAENSSNHCAAATSASIAAVSVLFSEPKIPQIVDEQPVARQPPAVSVLFSEPKIPQTFRRRCDELRQIVSVLFSEPKIPQTYAQLGQPPARHGFSALQRAENSSNADEVVKKVVLLRFQCSSASRKFLKSA